MHAKKDEAPLLQPNYSKSVRDVYLEVAQLCFTNLPHLTILGLAHHYQEDARSDIVKDLPSWVSNFTNNSYHETLWLQNMRCGRYAAFEAADRCSAEDYSPRVRGDQLHLRGRYCGTIAQRWISEVRPETETRERNDLYTSELLEALLQLSCQDLNLYDDGRLSESKTDAVAELITWASGARQETQLQAYTSIAQRFVSWARSQLNDILHNGDTRIDSGVHEPLKAWVTLKLGGVFGVNPESSRYKAIHRSMWEAYDSVEAATWLPTRSEIPKAVSLPNECIESASQSVEARMQAIVDKQRQCLVAVSQTIGHRGLYLTSNGLIGQCQVGAKPGDEIWLLQNAHIPFTLRRTKVRGRYTLVGECYVQRGMHGQMIDRGIAGELSDIILI